MSSGAASDWSVDQPSAVWYWSDEASIPRSVWATKHWAGPVWAHP